MTGQDDDKSQRVHNIDKYAHLDSMEGLSIDVEAGPRPFGVAEIKGLVPGILVAIVIALAASFLSTHYGGPVMFFALLIGLAFDFLSKEERTRAGIDFASKSVLRFGVALLGARITIDQVMAIGGVNVLAVVGAVIITIFSGLILARLMGVSKEQGLLSGGAVAICGASAALALSSVMPKTSDSERNTIFVVVAVTTLSTLAMIAYPILVGLLQFNDTEAGVFLGGTIHDVAQVVGAGYTVSEPAGDTSTIVKLLRVSMLLPTVIAFTLIYRKQSGQGDGKRPSTIPPFLIAFTALVAINSFGVIPEQAMTTLGDLSRWCLVTAIAALGMKTSFKALALIGWRPVILVVLETLVMAIAVLAYLLLS